MKKILLAIATLALVSAASTSAPAVRAGGIGLAAHRGGPQDGKHPENGLRAFAAAAKAGVRYLEVDVHLSSDGVPVVMHDGSLERTTDGAGPVGAYSRARLGAMRLRAPNGNITREHVPTLDEVAALAGRAGIGLVVDMKTRDDRTRYEGLEEAVLAVLDAHGITGASVVMALDDAIWQRALALRPGLRTGPLVFAKLPRDPVLAAAQGATFVGLGHRIANRDLVARAQAAGMVVAAFTVNDENDAVRVARAGVDIVISDAPSRLRAVLNANEPVALLAPAGVTPLAR